MSLRIQSLTLLTLVFLSSGALSGVTFAQRSAFETKDVRGVGITERLGESLPAGLVFRNHVGKEVVLQDLLILAYL